MASNVYLVLWGESVDPSGRPLALVIYRDRSFEYVPHSEFASH